MRVVSKVIRDSARGQDCTLRLPGCLWTTDTTVLAHLPCGHRGTGMKGPDTVAVYACQACHDVIDGRRPGDPLTLADALRALAETHERMIDAGLLTVRGMR